MQVAFHPCPLLCSLPPNSLPTTSNLFPSATPRRRFLSIPSTITNTTIPPNLPHSSSPSSSSAALDDYQRLFTSQPAESTDPLPLLPAKGKLPSDFPLGTYYLAGPGMMADDHGSTVNPLDGHGYLRAFHFIGGGVVMYSARYVKTAAVTEDRVVESGEWRFRRPGPFSMFKSSSWTSPVSNMMRNVANTTVLRWAGRLFCLWEGGHPYELEPTSLETIGLADLITTVEERQGGGGGGALNLVAGITKHFFHAMLGKHSKRTVSHYKIDAQRNRLLLLSCDTEDIFLPQSNFTFYEFDSNFELQQKKEFLITEQLLIHDWAFTDSYYIIMGNRTKTDVKGTFLAAAGLAPAISSISVNSSQPTTPIYVLPRFSDNAIFPGRNWTRAPVEAPCQLWTMHMGNAFEEKNVAGNIQINVQASVCSYHWFSYRKMFGYDERSSKLDPTFMNQEKEMLPHLVLISIELDGKGSCISCSVTDSSTNWRKPCDFPVINPSNSGKANRFMYASSTSGSTELLPHFPFDTVVKIDCSNGDVSSWSTESRRFIGEPMFVPKSTSAGDEEDGYVVVVEYAVCRHRCYLVVLDARRIGDDDDAVVVKLEVPEQLTFPFGFHGFWEGE